MKNEKKTYCSFALAYVLVDKLLVPIARTFRQASYCRRYDVRPEMRRESLGGVPACSITLSSERSAATMLSR